MQPSPAHPHAALRRQDREISDRAEIDAILRAARVMYLALADNDVPFVVPVFFAYDGVAVYFHSAQAGTKVNILKRNPTACFAVSIDHGVVESARACDFEAKHRTVIGCGTAAFIEDEEDKVRALDRIVARFSDRKFDYPAANLAHTAVIRIAIESLKGKKHGC
jgi:nitroimidazol reductase NimA-like FMN-containing flavoprotein (pyridoxamine 5'-phosphate oxidase superfamily)